MKDSLPSTEAVADLSVPIPEPAADAPVRSIWQRRLLLAVPVILLVVILLTWWHALSSVNDLRRDVAQRLQAGDNVNSETKLVAKTMQETVKELQAKVNVLEGKQVEAQTQQVALEQLYQELARNRDDWALAEIEQVLSTASQQLQLAGNVRGALIALQNADLRLSRSDKPQFITIRRALAQDMERLKALPQVDLTGLALRLDSLVVQLDGLPLLAGEKPVVTANPVKKSAAAAAGARPGWLSTVQDALNASWSEFMVDLRQVVRVRNVETADALLLSPTQEFYARENLKLRLLNARLALLSRNESTFRTDLAAAEAGLNRYFDVRARSVQAALATLKQLQTSNVVVEVPTLNLSLDAVRNFKAKP